MHKVRTLPPEKPVLRVSVTFAEQDDEYALTRFCDTLWNILQARRKARQI